MSGRLSERGQLYMAVCAHQVEARRVLTTIIEEGCTEERTRRRIMYCVLRIAYCVLCIEGGE